MTASGELQRSRLARWRQKYRARRFGILLVALGLLLALPPMLLGFGASVAAFDVLMSLVILTAILSLCCERRQRMLAILLGVPAILLHFTGNVLAGDVSDGSLFMGRLLGMLFFFGSAGLIIVRLFDSSSMTLDSVYGAMCGYLLLGSGWALCYALVETVQPGSFAISPLLEMSIEAGEPPLHVLTYYSFVTLTTVGYGDVSPVAPMSRTFAWIEAITGQFYLAVIVAGLVSMLVARHPGSSSSPRT